MHLVNTEAKAETQKNPTEHERFLEARGTCIELHNSNPDSRFTKEYIWLPEVVSNLHREEDELEAPEEEFVRLAEWQK